MQDTQSKSGAIASSKTRFTFPGTLRLAAAVLGGVILGWAGATGCVAKRTELNYPLIAEAWSTIQRHYVDRAAIKSTPETYGAIAGMVDALGDTGHSTFLTPDMVKQLKFVERGELEGIGVEINMKHGHIVIVAPIDGTPAQRAGLRSGDIILRVDGQDTLGWPLAKVVKRITGRPGTKVKLGILNPKTGHMREVTLVRASIKLHDVYWARLPGTAIVDLRITSFDQHVGTELQTALKSILPEKPAGIILDLRNNPGGILDQAVAVASQFLDHGNVLLVKDAKGRTKPVPVKKGGIATNVPMAVLINIGTASAAEIVAGALEDAHRATLIGSTTFGTGTVLGEFRMPDGSALLLAIEEWLTPDGHSFWHKGIKPEIAVGLPDDATPLLPEAARNMTPAEVKSSKDAQLMRAIQLLASKSASTASANSSAKP